MSLLSTAEVLGYVIVLPVRNRYFLAAQRAGLAKREYLT
jgi:hypothetical protein